MKAPRIHNRVFFFFRSIEIISNFYLELDEPIKYRDKGGGRGGGGNENLENSEFRRGLIRRGAAVMARDAIK